MQEQRLCRDTEWVLGEERNWAAEVGRGRQTGEGASGQLPQVSCQKSNHKKAGGEQQGKEREKGDEEGGREGTKQPLHTNSLAGGCE